MLHLDRMRATACLIFAVVAVASCNDAVSPDRGALELHLGRWTASGVVSYQYRFERSCFCAPDDTRPVLIRVDADSIVSIQDALTGEVLDQSVFDRYPTVGGLFEIILDAIELQAQQLEVRYHEQFGYPTRIVIDYRAQISDEELFIEARELEPLDPAP